MNKYVAFLRGINVGGHHKVPMAELREVLSELDFTNIVTILNSGNILIDSIELPTEEAIARHLEAHFGFPIPTRIQPLHTLSELMDDNPFEGISVEKHIRLYVSFLKHGVADALELPWESEDQSFHILERRDSMIFSVLDLSVSKTPKAMVILEKSYGKDITTRNWNTILRTIKKAES